MDLHPVGPQAGHELHRARYLRHAFPGQPEDEVHGHLDPAVLQQPIGAQEILRRVPAGDPAQGEVIGCLQAELRPNLQAPRRIGGQEVGLFRVQAVGPRGHVQTAEGGQGKSVIVDLLQLGHRCIGIGEGLEEQDEGFRAIAGAQEGDRLPHLGFHGGAAGGGEVGRPASFLGAVGAPAAGPPVRPVRAGEARIDRHPVHHAPVAALQVACVGKVGRLFLLTHAMRVADHAC